VKVRGSESGVRSKRSSLLCRLFLVLIIPWILLSAPSAYSQDMAIVEARLTNFIKQIYNDGDDIRVKFGTMPGYLKEGVRVKSVNFSRVPDMNGDGVCLVEVEGKSIRERNVYVSFKVLTKKRLFVLKQTGKKGETVEGRDITVKETYLSGGSNLYPSSMEDVVGKKLKKDLPAGTILTTQALDDSVLVQRGELVNIVGESRRLVVQTKGQTLEKGKLGDMIKVKNIMSGKQVLGRITGNSTVTVEF
jgi:flagella basal body P-ring formation protein FlgA